MRVAAESTHTRVLHTGVDMWTGAGKCTRARVTVEAPLLW